VKEEGERGGMESENDSRLMILCIITQCIITQCTANPTWGVIFESSKLKAQTSLLSHFNEKRRSSFEL